MVTKQCMGMAKRSRGKARLYANAACEAAAVGAGSGDRGENWLNLEYIGMTGPQILQTAEQLNNG